MYDKIFDEITWLSDGEDASALVLNRSLKELVELMDSADLDFVTKRHGIRITHANLDNGIQECQPVYLDVSNIYKLAENTNAITRNVVGLYVINNSETSSHDVIVSSGFINVSAQNRAYIGLVSDIEPGTNYYLSNVLPGRLTTTPYDGATKIGVGINADTLYIDISPSLTGAQILTALVAVDGSDSGLDADLLDGNDSLYFATKASVDNINKCFILNELNKSTVCPDKLNADTLEGHPSLYFATQSDVDGIPRHTNIIAIQNCPSYVELKTDTSDRGSAFIMGATHDVAGVLTAQDKQYLDILSNHLRGNLLNADLLCEIPCSEYMLKRDMPDGVGGTSGEFYPKGGETDKIFHINGVEVKYDYTIPDENNAGTFGPIMIKRGVVITIPDGSVWTITGGKHGSPEGNPKYTEPRCFTEPVTTSSCSGDFGGSLAVNGFATFPNGMIMQWGRVTGTTNTRTIFPISFPNAVFSVVATANGITDAGTGGYISTGTSALRNADEGGFLFEYAVPHDWVAIGY